uniref:Pyrroline-5-carboxylate reductase n=1 Tax=OCS116 cluster bacterium TaxID=2030921 RepID=A0A2A4YZB1_9PROT
MTQTNSKFFDDIAKVTTNMVSAAEGVMDEAKEMAKNQGEKWVNELELVKREEFDVLKEMIVKLTLENAELIKRIDVLEGKSGGK